MSFTEIPSINPKSPSDHVNDEERKGLLSGADDHEYETQESEYAPRPEWSQRKIVVTAVVFIGLLISGVFARSFLLSSSTHPNLFFNGDNVRSNGTHDFKRTVLIVSIDGLR